MRDDALRELLLAELELRRRAGENLSEREYLQRFPGSPAVVRDAFSITRREWGRGLHVRCPHCQNPIELVPDAALESIHCPSCGSDFSLLNDGIETRAAREVSQLGHFRLVERVGVGAYGSVWKALDTQLDRTVAVKVPRRGQLDAKQRAAFLREARSAAQLRHPNIVPVHEVGRDGECVYIVSDYIRGVPLSEWLACQRPTTREAAELCIKIAGALHHAHERGVIHRDLKPSNIMLDGDGEPYLMDFGLARREVGELTMTVDGHVLGTPAYMSPEQAQGEAHTADRRTDVYSLGVILFQLLTGELPFRGSTRMLLHQVIHDEPPSPRRLNATVPRDLETITLKCLEKAPGGRYPTVAAVGEELQRYLDRVPIRTRPIGRLQRAVRWGERRPLHATLLGLVLVLAIAGPCVAMVIERQRHRLAELVREKDDLIMRREDEGRDAAARSAALRNQLDLWEGRANPWTLWPPDPAAPPKQRQLASLLSARGAALGGTSDDPWENAQRLLTLATLLDGTGRPSDAERRLIEASKALELLRIARPDSTSVPLALADCYDRLSVCLAGRDREQSLQWLDDALEIRESLANRRTDDPMLQAGLLDARMRVGAAAGFEDAGQHLTEAQKLDARLSRLWPETTDELYRLTCQLAGRQPLLAVETAVTPAASATTE